MFFNDQEKIPEIAKNTGFSIFVADTFPNLPESSSSIIIEPEQGKIRIDQIREITELVKTIASSHRFIIIKNAETMNPEAQNAFLKLLEEPKDNYHFVMLTKEPSILLKTVLSRAQIYFFRQTEPQTYDQETKALAKSLITATGQNLVKLAEDLANKKLHKTPREDAEKITAAAIDLLSNSYFETKNPKFLKKLRQLITLHQNLTRNGHIKLHIIADLC